MTTLIQDLRFGLRMLAKNPGFTAVAVITLALGIGANTVVFSVFNTVILHAVPYPQADRLVHVWGVSKFTGSMKTPLTLPEAVALVNQSRAFESVGFYQRVLGLDLTGAGSFETLSQTQISPGLFKTLGVGPMLGRSFHPEDTQAGNPLVVILNSTVWQIHFGADRNVIGREIQLGDKPYRVVGVMPPGFEFPTPGSQIWTPQPITADALQNRIQRGFGMIGRLRHGVDAKSAQAELNVLALQLGRENPQGDEGFTLSLTFLQDDLAGRVKTILWIFLGAAGLVLLIACANVANLLLARNAGRQREIAVRIAMGAGRIRLVRQLLMESLLLSFAGAGVALALAVWAVRMVRVLGPATIPRLNQSQIDGWALAFTLAVAVLASLLFGVAPALRSSKPDIVGSLKEGALTSHVGFAIVRGRRLQSLLVVVQLALAMVILIGSSLFLRSLSHLLLVPLGFEPSHVLSMSFPVSSADPERLKTAPLFLQQILEEVRTLPGVESAALVENQPLSGLTLATVFGVEEPGGAWKVIPWVELQTVSADYFRTMRIPVLRGRTFTEQDTRQSPCVLVVNQSMARTYWPGVDPVGKRIDLNFTGWRRGKPAYCEVVGLVGDSRDIRLETSPGPEVYYPFARWGGASSALVVRTVHDPLAAANSILDRIQAIDKTRKIMWIMSLEQAVDKSVLEPRFRAALIAVMAFLSLALASLGVYGVFSHFVSQRTHEIGIRRALGAQRGEILLLILQGSIVLIVISITIGVGGAMALTHVLKSFLFEVAATDTATFFAVPILLAGVALLASYIPARRAAKIDPMVALRYE